MHKTLLYRTQVVSTCMDSILSKLGRKFDNRLIIIIILGRICYIIEEGHKFQLMLLKFIIPKELRREANRIMDLQIYRATMLEEGH